MSACLNLGIETESENNNFKHNFCAEKSRVQSEFLNIDGLFHSLSNFWSKCMVSRVHGFQGTGCMVSRVRVHSFEGTRVRGT